MNEDVLLFPGQGAQSTGMGRDVCDSYGASREIFRVANQVLGVELDSLCFNGPEDDLSRTDISQPAILTVSVAVLRAIEQETGKPVSASAAAGLSLGEYTALVAAGSIEFADAVRLVHHRGQYMQQACDERPGVMCSIIGLPHSQVEEACREVRERSGGGTWPANYNTATQLVISGEEKATQEAVQRCEQMGASKIIMLNVAGAFHTELMAPAADRLRAELERTAFKTAEFPVIANVSGLPVRNPDEIRTALCEQITSPVRWADSMEWLLAQGARNFYEVGPGRVLRGLLRRINPDAACRSVGSSEDVRRFAGCA